MRVKIYNIRYKEKESVINVCGYDALSNWLYRRDVAKQPTATSPSTAPKQFTIDLIGYTPESLLGDRYNEGNEYIKDYIRRETGLEVEDFDLKIPNQYLYR